MHVLARWSCRLTMVGAGVVVFAACGGGGGGSSVPGASPTPVRVVPSSQPTVAASPSASPGVNAAAYVCPTSDTVASAMAPRIAQSEGMRRMSPRTGRLAASAATGTQLIAVNYDAPTLLAHRSTLAQRETALGATLAHEYTFSHVNLVTRVLRVPAAQVARVEASLRQSPGARSVGLTGAPRHATSVNAGYFPNDPFFDGFATPAIPTGSATAPPATNNAPPLYESADVPGQWDMHTPRFEDAFAYSQAANGSGITSAGALGSSTVKLAVIDTGEDSTHPELASKIVYQRCYISNPNTSVQSTSDFSTDEDGHGTDVAGIAGGATNNGLGFTAAGGNVSLFAYRVFPTPDDNCTSDTSTDTQCETTTTDIVSAIQDAIVNHVNVISMSLGGTACSSTGVDSDPAEGAAVADAIASNIIVVAAAGNGSGPPVETPACDTGVIAVGATSLADGTANGSNKAGGSLAAPFEYVASYTDYGSAGTTVPGSATSWGIVAPGGDPSGGLDTDDLHWIENIWTTTPFDVKNFGGNCVSDYPLDALSGTIDCRVLIAGTSMATPHVAGAAALIIAANPTYQNPTLMKQLLCSTADDISDPNQGCGRLDVYRAMATALGDANIPAAAPIP